MTTIAETLDRACAAYRLLVTVGEAVEDEWQYVTDLSRVWLAELERVAAARGVEAALPATDAAVDRLTAEIGRISDPHRAIDWLSTFPQAVLLALPPAPAPAAASAAPAPTLAPSGPAAS